MPAPVTRAIVFGSVIGAAHVPTDTEAHADRMRDQEAMPHVLEMRRALESWNRIATSGYQDGETRAASHRRVSEVWLTVMSQGQDHVVQWSRLCRLAGRDAAIRGRNIALQYMPNSVRRLVPDDWCDDATERRRQ